jgi:hypothetical protein
VTVDFAKGKADPVKTFESMAVLLEGFRKFDHLMLGALDPHIETVMVLEDVEAAPLPLGSAANSVASTIKR